MAGIYVHIPFCRKACHYCNFHFSTNTRSMDAMIHAICKELNLRKVYLQDQPVESIYFGGGTPSLVSAELLSQILVHIHQEFQVHHAAEITLEANPDDINPEALQSWRTIGINRLSVGIQSFDPDELMWMNRAHTASQAHACIPMIQESGFSNFSIDLIYGSPMLSDGQLATNIAIAVKHEVPHIAAYALTIEPQTALAHFVAKGKSAATDAEKQVHQSNILMQALEDAGYEHYEISNFAKPGFRSRHNSSYWMGKHYLGVGPGAHSFNGHSRQWNIANNALYLQSIELGEIPEETEHLTPTQQLNEYIMTSLRTIEGLSLAKLETWGSDHAQSVKNAAIPFLADGRLIQHQQALILSRSGKSWADGIAAALFQD
jgi:oxygen-independent coproporphyrinogen-3 oxidase